MKVFGTLTVSIMIRRKIARVVLQCSPADTALLIDAYSTVCALLSLYLSKSISYSYRFVVEVQRCVGSHYGMLRCRGKGTGSASSDG
jgi:hypothetical protein